MKTSIANNFERQVWAHLRLLRGQMVMLDADLAWFLGVGPDRIASAVQSRPECFPADFVFRLSGEKLDEWQRESPCVTGKGLLPDHEHFAFTTHGAGMLLMAFNDEEFALAAIPVLRAFAKFWEQTDPAKHPPRVNRIS